MPEPLNQSNQIDALWDYDHPAESEAAFRRALETLNEQADTALRLELLTQISRLKPTDKNYDEKIETLIENVEHHVEEEEGQIFRFAEENCTQEQLEDLGRQIEDRKKILDQQMAA